MDFMSRAQEFMATKTQRLSEDLAEKYGVTEDEIYDIVSCFLKDTYGPALEVAKSISKKTEKPIMLFIGREDCAICQRSWPEIERFLQTHDDIELVKLNYTNPPGLLYHMIHQEEKGQLPLIAMIFQGCIKMAFTGECIHPEVYERYYEDIGSGCSQNIYAL